MTRKDFNLMANAFRALHANASPEEKKTRAAELVALLQATNERFDSEKFLAACLGK